MEIFLRLLLIVVKVLSLIISPILDHFVYPQKPKRTRLPPIKNPLLLQSIQELRSRLRSRQVTYSVSN